MNLGYRLAIVGSREWTNYEKFTEEMTEFVSRCGKPRMVISGGARGVDTMAAKWATEQSIELVIFKPNYEVYGKKAPLVRNTAIAAGCERMVAFPHPNSGGTWDAIRKFEQFGRKAAIIQWQPE